MSSRLLAIACTLGSFACVGPGHAPPTLPLNEPFRVLLLGDSISIGYTPHVQELLADHAHVVRPTRPNGRPENCQGTTRGIARLEDWLQIDGGRFDVVHLNFGLHDLKRVDPLTGRNSSDPNDPQQADPERYESQLRSIVERLRATGARLILATTTPIPTGELRPYRGAGEAWEYNQVALRVAAEYDLHVNDLFGFVIAHRPVLSRPGDVHFDATGTRLLAERVAESILAVAGARAR